MTRPPDATPDTRPSSPPEAAPAPTPAPGQVVDLLATSPEELEASARQWFGRHKGSGLARRIHQRALRAGEFAPERLGAGPRTAAEWRRRCRLALPEIETVVEEPTAHGQLAKYRLRLADGNSIESVHLPMGRGRSSLCVSTQVGCARACTFCETGLLGLKRNLTIGEILGQVTLQHRSRRPDSIVFQGMGEPLDNLDALLPALARLTDASGFGYAQDRLTICTVGHVPGIEALAGLDYRRLGLSLSLNSADDARRAELMTHSVRYPLAEIQASLIAYRKRRNLALGVHWCLLPGINDRERDADELAAFVAPLGRTFVHVIPYNPGTAPIARPPSEDEIRRFVLLLRERGLAVRRRITKGRSVMAGCGQLGSASGAP